MLPGSTFLRGEDYDFEALTYLRSFVSQTHRGTERPQICPGLRTVTNNRFIYYFAIDETLSQVGIRLIPLLRATPMDGAPGREQIDSIGRCSYCVLMPARWKNDRPLSRAAFARRFPDDRACALYLASKRWPDGFVCPACGGVKSWELVSEKFTWECAACSHQTSVTTGAVMHQSKVPLTTWFMAAHIVASHCNGISAVQLQGQLGLGSYKTAWLLLHKLRRAMVAPGRDPLTGNVEVDETTIPCRTKDEPVAGGFGRSPIGKMVIVGAVELLEGNRLGRIRLSRAGDYQGDTLKGFVRANAVRGAQIWTDGNSSYGGLDGYGHIPRVIGSMAAHVLMPWVHRIFSNLKRWALGVYHGLRKKHVQRYLDEFVFRWNRRHSYSTAFDRLLGLTTAMGHMSYRDLVEGV